MATTGTEREPEILTLIEGFLKRHAMTASALGTMAMGDPRVVFEMRKGRRVKEHNIALIRRTLESYDCGEFVPAPTRSGLPTPRHGLPCKSDDYDGLGEYAGRKEMMRIGNEMFLAALFRELKGIAARHNAAQVLPDGARYVL